MVPLQLLLPFISTGNDMAFIGSFSTIFKGSGNVPDSISSYRFDVSNVHDYFRTRAGRFTEWKQDSGTARSRF
jgi:hypothetical protein